MDKNHQVLQIMLDEALHKNAKKKSATGRNTERKATCSPRLREKNLELQECYNKMKDKRCSGASMKCRRECRS